MYTLSKTGTIIHTSDPRAREAPLETPKHIADYVESHETVLKPEIQRALVKGTVINGMDKEQVKLLLGNPNDINASADVEHWIYFSGKEGFGGQRWLTLPLVPFIVLPAGREYYEIIFDGSVIKEIRYSTTICI